LPAKNAVVFILTLPNVIVPVNVGDAFGARILTAFEYALSACVCAEAARVLALIAFVLALIAESYAVLTELGVAAVVLFVDDTESIN